MSDFVTLACPSCGGQLQITADVDRFACAHCGSEHLVKRGGGIVTLAPVVDGIKKVQAGVDRTASELAIVRLEKEIDQLEQQILATRRKATSFSSGDYYAAVGIAFLVGLIGYAIDPCLGLVLGIVALLVALAVVYGPLQSKKIEPLKQQIEQRKQEIARHRRILSR